MESHDNSPEDVVKVQTFVLDINPRNTRKLQYHHGRRRHAPRKNGAWCGCRVAGSTASVRSTDIEYNGNWSTSRSCGKCGAKHPETIGHSDTENASNDEGNAAAIWYRASERTSVLWRPWVPQWTRKLSWPRRTRCATQRKYARWLLMSCKQGSNKLLLDPWNVWSY